MPRNQGTSRKGKPKKNERAAGMGRSLQKVANRRHHTPSGSTGGMAMRPGVDSINVKNSNEDFINQRSSVLERNDLDDFLIQAEMANRAFAIEREQHVILDSTAQHPGTQPPPKSIQWSDQPVPSNKIQFAFHELSVPRRPAWDETTTPEELDKREKESFLDWRRAIAKKEEEIIHNNDNNGMLSLNPLGVTPFEKNLEIWRQLWRVMERCSCIIQIVDARNPLFYLSQDLRAYATQELGKPMLLLINKSDYLSPLQRKAWNEYFSNAAHKWEHVFFSAHEQQDRLDKKAAEEHARREEGANLLSQEEDDDDDGDDDEDEEDSNDRTPETSDPTVETEETANVNKSSMDNVGVETPLSREELLNWLLGYAERNSCSHDPKYDRIPFGMVGFPNVGKSSVINVLMGNAKSAHGVVRVGVAAQPGKTKHFQTLLLPDRDNIMLCDCPGLVFPSFVNNTADLIAAGVYPIAQMRDPWPVVNLLCRRIPRNVLNAQYGIHIPLPSSDIMLKAKVDHAGRTIVPPPTAEEFLTTYCIARNMLAASSGVPDFQRASRIVIKDYAVGKLLYCHSPPTFDNEVFQNETMVTAMEKTRKLREKLLIEREKDPAEEENDCESDGDNDGEDDDEVPPRLEDDALLLELMGETSLGSSAPVTQQTQATRKKKWGKKGRKLRNKDPYGCHSTPDEVLGESGVTTVGLSVKAGKKHNRKGYVRPTGYGLARTAIG